MAIISIIVPVYNTEKYLSKCIDSILHQKFTDFELILVDDGSTDSSSTICDHYERLDPRVKCIHRPNRGQSAARNYGLQFSTGKYIGFVDSDDYVSPLLFETLYNNIITYHSDLSICGSALEYSNRTVYSEFPDGKFPKVLSQKEALIDVCKDDGFGVYLWNKLFKRELIEKYPLKEGHIYEDALIIVPMLLEENIRIVFSPEPYYYYVQRQNSSMHQAFTESNFEYITVWMQNPKLVTEKYSDLKPYYDKRVYNNCFKLLDKIYLDPCEHLSAEQRIVDILAENFMSILRNNFMTYHQRIMIHIIRFCYPLYKWYRKNFLFFKFRRKHNG